MGLMGYHVGQAGPSTAIERHKVLEGVFFTQALELEINDPSYVERWGAAKSPERLQSMARHISFLINLTSGKGWRDKQCFRDWTADLTWLKKTHYRKSMHKFAWPEPNSS
jgi:hypothetical protein